MQSKSQAASPFIFNAGVIAAQILALPSVSIFFPLVRACLSEGCYTSLSSISAVEHSAISSPARPISYLAKQVNLTLTAVCYLVVSLIYFTRNVIFAFHLSVTGLGAVLADAKEGWLALLCASLPVWHCHVEERAVTLTRRFP